jgi:hypothetical protein
MHIVMKHYTAAMTYYMGAMTDYMTAMTHNTLFMLSCITRH